MQRRSVLKKLKFRVSETAKAIQEENQKEYFIELQSLRYCFCKECEQNNQTEVEQNKTKKKNQKHLAIDEKVNHCYSKGKIQRKQTKITLQFLDFIAKKKKKSSWSNDFPDVSFQNNPKSQISKSNSPTAFSKPKNLQFSISKHNPTLHGPHPNHIKPKSPPPPIRCVLRQRHNLRQRCRKRSRQR